MKILVVTLLLAAFLTAAAGRWAADRSAPPPTFRPSLKVSNICSGTNAL